MRGRLLPNGRVDLVRQICLFGGSYLLYRLLESAIAHHQPAAFRHAGQLISLERALHVFIEPSVQSWAAGSHLLLVIAVYVYINAQTTLLVGALLYLYIRHNRNYYFVRNMLLVAMVIALACYTFYPTAPPRFLPEWGFTDTLQYITGVSSRNVSGAFVNSYGAVPSMHVAFAAILSWSLVRVVRSRIVRVLWMVWPLLITFVTIITGNHFLADAVLGLVTAAIAAGVARGLAAIRPHAWAPAWAPAPAASPASAGSSVAIT